MGWSERFHQTDSALEQAMNQANQHVEIYNRVLGFVTSLLDIDDKLEDAHQRIKVEQVGSIKLTLEKEIAILRSEGRRFAGRMASYMGVEIRHDVFSGSGPSHRASWNGPMQPQGNVANLPRLG
jgi:hypothetical protein